MPKDRPQQATHVRYRQAKAFVLAKVRSGEWKPGNLIPSENKLTVELGMSRMTVNRALRELTDEGELVRVSGVGTFVASPKPQSSLIKIANIADEIQARGHRYSFQILSLARESASLNVAAALNLRTGSSVHHLICLHFEDDVPVQLEDRYVNAQLVPEFLQQPFGEGLQPAQYLLNTIAADDIEHIVDAVLPTPEEIQQLQISENDPCLVLTRRTWSENQGVTFVRLVHPSSRYRLGSRVLTSASDRSG